ncbi:MAG: methionyl-tRNA formyltransferase [Bacteroidia bacterium]
MKQNKIKIAIIGRSELLFKTAISIKEMGFEIPLVVTAKEAPEYKVKSSDFKNFADKCNATFIHTAKINKAEYIEQIKACGPIDIAVSINYNGIIAQEVIDLFPLGILNAHGGDLPRYRGNACQAWAIINGEEKIGMCIHKMRGGELDNGDIIARGYYQLLDTTRIVEVYDWMETCIPELMSSAIDSISKNTNFILDKQSEDPKDTLRCYPRNQDDGKIDWNKSAVGIDRLIRASSEPFSGAFCYLDEQKLTIWRAQLVYDEEIYLSSVGQVAGISSTGIEVITSSGKLRLLEIEYNGVRTTEPNQIIKSIRKRLK